MLVRLLIITDVVAVLVELGGALTGGWALYLAAGPVAVLTLVVAVWLEQGTSAYSGGVTGGCRATRQKLQDPLSQHDR